MRKWADEQEADAQDHPAGQPADGLQVKWSTPAQILYRGILSDADSVEYVKRTYNRKCMLERNQRLIDSTGVLLAVYNGEKRGGTAATVRYAQKAGREIIVIDPITRSVSRSETALSPAHP